MRNMGKEVNIISDSPHMPQEHGDSAMQNTSVGSGSRPTPSKFKIDTSAPEDPHTLGRDVPGSLK
jgi:hypothetical protein